MRRAVAAATAVTAVLALVGCSPTITLTPAPQATTAACAGVIVRVASQTLGTATPRTVDAQGTAAWGDPLAVTLYCGVALAPSDDLCYPFDGVDWKTAARTVGGTAYEVLTTVGRVPIVQLVVDPARASVNDALQPVSDAVKAATASSGSGCDGGTSPSPSPSSSPSSSSSPTPAP